MTYSTVFNSSPKLAAADVGQFGLVVCTLPGVGPFALQITEVDLP